MSPQPQQSYTLTHDVQVARPKPGKALPVSVEDLAYIKAAVPNLKPEINLFISIGFLFVGSALACLLQVCFGTFQRKDPSTLSTNETILWCMTAFCVLAAFGSFIFSYLRYKDSKKQESDLIKFLTLLENKFEALS